MSFHRVFGSRANLMGTYLLTLLSVLVCMVVWGIALTGVSSAQERDEVDSLYDVLGRPVTIAYFNPITDIEELMFELDDDGLLDRSGDWRPLLEADVWVFFLANSSDLSLLPKVLLDEVGDSLVPPKGGMRRTNVHFDDGREAMMILVRMDAYLPTYQDTYPCLISRAIYGEIQMYGEIKTRDAITGC